ncbi:AAA family ATPase [Alkalisalibacterium limincola]|nr:ATP-binding protein [Alkalisalibacterium limincola]
MNTLSSTSENLSRFREAVAADLFSPSDIVEFSSLSKSVERLRPAVDRLQAVADGGLSPQSLGSAFVADADTYRLVCRFFAISADIALEDHRRLSAKPPKNLDEATYAAAIMVEFGVANLLAPHVDVEKLVMLTLIGDDAKNRRFRVDAKIRQRIELAVERAVEAAKSSGYAYEIVSPSSLGGVVRPVPDYVISLGGTPRVIIASTFQSHSGGRQTRELTTQYPMLANEARRHGLELILVADGKGIRDASKRSLSLLFEAVPLTLTIAQAESELMQSALREIAERERLISIDEVVIDKLISAGLDRELEIAADDLPVSPQVGRFALARYASANSNFALIVDPGGTRLRWQHHEVLRAFQTLQRKFEHENAVDIVANYLGGREIVVVEGSEYGAKLFDLSEGVHQIVCIAAKLGTVNVEVLQQVSRQAMHSGESCRIAVLIVSHALSEQNARVISDSQVALPVTVITLDLDTCIAFARSNRDPSELLQEALLNQSDLTKLSPFVLRGVTPERVFFGREEEEATLLATLATNSVALLGGRRIGKTSLMQHSFARLRSANLHPFFGDCQVVRTWTDFGQLVIREWGVELEKDFVPSDLFSIVNQLRARGSERVVILLDEIDQLLDWDSRHEEDEVPEAFFRTCRSISQQGLAQFVFSGERTIAKRIWDPSSPHWNFCRPMMLRQLTQAAAGALISEPLVGLGISIDNIPEVAKAVWTTTDGHPELIQVIGDGVISLVNERSRDDVFVSANDIEVVTSNYEFAEQYLETYWGQANPLERAVSIMLLSVPQPTTEFLRKLSNFGVFSSEPDIVSALRMLELYGIADQDSVGYAARLSWFHTALQYYGGSDAVLSRFAKGAKG